MACENHRLRREDEHIMKGCQAHLRGSVRSVLGLFATPNIFRVTDELSSPVDQWRRHPGPLAYFNESHCFALRKLIFLS